MDNRGPGLPDGIFSYQNPNFGKFSLEWKMLAILNILRRLGLSILWHFGIFCDYLVNFSPFWYFAPR
jgi:hypothetical protein